MFYLQIFLPAGLVLLLFSFGHLLVKTDYSGVYYTEQVDALIGSESLQGLTDTELSSGVCQATVTLYLLTNTTI